MTNRGGLFGAALAIGTGVLIAPAVLMVMVLTGSRTELPGGGCGTQVAAVGDGTSIDELTREQVANAATIVSVGLRMQIPRQGIVIALATAHQESRFLNYANDGIGFDLRVDQRGIGRSLELPHQAVGSDHGSLGVFQQQWPWWGTMPELMDPATAAAKFYARLVKVPGWSTMPVTQAAQAVQHSAHPDAYADDEALALQLLDDPALGSGDAANAVWAGDTGGSMCPAPAMYSGTVVMPLHASARFTDLTNFGHQGGRWSRGHTGTDFSTPCGTPVRAAHDGTVIVETDQSWAGNWLVKVSSGPGSLTTWYAHMQAINIENGQRVTAGQQIGQVGSLGNSSGCHLHFEVHPAGGSIYEDDVDPTEWLQARVGPDIQPVASSRSQGFVLATFNLLGDSLTRPGGPRPGWASSQERMRWAVEALDRHGVEVVGLQELQLPQHRELRRIASDRYATWFPPGDTLNSIAWRRDRWAFVSADTFQIPYFEGRLRDVPIVRLRQLSTGQDAIFINVHNPADTARHPNQERFRADALRREVAVANALTAAYDVPVFLTGDFNHRAPAFCALTAGGVLTASAGGSNADRCVPPRPAQIDWIFGSARSTWTSHSIVRTGIQGRITDHPLVVAKALITTSAAGGN